MGPSAKSVPVTSNTTQQVALPPWMTQAGEKAVGVASGIADRPYQAYEGPLNSNLSPNTANAIDLAGNSTNTGKPAIEQAAATASNASNAANAAVGTGSGALGSAANLYGNAGAVAQGSTNAGAPQVNAANTSLMDALHYGGATVGTGMGGADTMAALSGLAGAKAVGSTGAGQGDLNMARYFAAGSAAPITGSDIAGYMNPYIKQALDPAAEQLRHQSDVSRQGIDRMAAMRGAFGGSRQGLLEGENERNLMLSLNNLYGPGYANAYDKASSMASDALQRKAGASSLFQGTASGADTQANSAIQRLLDAARTSGAAGSLQSDLATASQGRMMAPAPSLLESGRTSSALSSEALNRLLSTGGANIGLAGAQSNLASNDVNRMLGTVNPSLEAGGAQLSQLQTTLSNLVSTGQIEQTQAQNMIDTAYKQFLEERDWAANQLNALTSTLSGVPYGTQTTQNMKGSQIVGGSDQTGQMVGGAATLGAAAITVF